MAVQSFGGDQEPGLYMRCASAFHPIALQSLIRRKLKNGSLFRPSQLRNSCKVLVIVKHFLIALQSFGGGQEPGMYMRCASVFHPIALHSLIRRKHKNGSLFRPSQLRNSSQDLVIVKHFLIALHSFGGGQEPGMYMRCASVFHLIRSQRLLQKSSRTVLYFDHHNLEIQVIVKYFLIPLQSVGGGQEPGMCMRCASVFHPITSQSLIQESSSTDFSFDRHNLESKFSFHHSAEVFPRRSAVIGGVTNPGRFSIKVQD